MEYIKNRREIVSTFSKKTANDNVRQIRGGFPNTERSNTNEYAKDNHLISRKPEQPAHRRGKYEWLISKDAQRKSKLKYNIKPKKT